MNEYTNALTAVIIDGIEQGSRDAVQAAYTRMTACKRSNARKLADALAAAGYDPTPARVTPKAPARKAARKAPAKAAKAPKPERTPEEQAHTELRKQAWTLLMDERKAAKAAGRKAQLTYAEACELMGTTPAKAAR